MSLDREGAAPSGTWACAQASLIHHTCTRLDPATSRNKASKWGGITERPAAVLILAGWEDLYGEGRGCPLVAPTPIFFLKDPVKFPNFFHAQERYAQSNLAHGNDTDMFWDYLSQNPESIHQVMI
ncbi:hypothetical protein PCANC_21332 [Puccinia coronata f. sp. avenae]|uniref:Catalase core domain-containing protein n=1 Tax=Puccinia coronata f. sp. avenae TaxID=200324 RepID=A0A2N5SE57_9BASI|nr:hypothetical protein PCANC_21332 [Puccinia coronata f. sp. avenae]PLW50131.1 hypothetical protein PCASD_01793 [Puccinia coronata f. sp. avenae]